MTFDILSGSKRWALPAEDWLTLPGSKTPDLLAGLLSTAADSRTYSHWQVARQEGAEGIKRATAKGERRLAMKELQESVQANAFIPRSATLEDWSNREWTDGVQINALRELDTLSVETKHHTYEITIIDPNTAEIMIRGGEIFPEASAALVLGASSGGSCLKLRGIYVGFKIELLVDGRRIITSPVRSIALARE